jgi:hypothetical protein
VIRSFDILLGAGCALALFYFFWPLGLAFAAVWPVLLYRRMSIRRPFYAACGLVLIGHLLLPPRLDRDWSEDQARWPDILLEGDRLSIRNMRDFGYRDVDDFLPRWLDKTYDLGALEVADFVVERFGAWEGAGHSFVTFGFAGGERLAISIEIRKERGESFGALKGIFKRFELMYVLGTERDLIGLRRNVRKNEVAVYPVRAPKEKLRAMLRSMLARAKKLGAEPEFYNTLWNACTTNLADHVNEISPRRIPFSLKLRAAGYADDYAGELGLIGPGFAVPVAPLDDPAYSDVIRGRK